MRTTISLILFFVVSQSLPAQEDLLQKEIAKIIKYEAGIDFDLAPGILVGVIDGNSTYVMSYGEKLSRDSIFELGSVSKPIVAWLVGEALDSLGWSLEDPVCRFLPDSLCQGVWKTLTIQDVLVHRSGLKRFPSAIAEQENSVADPYSAYDATQLTHDIKAMIPDPGTYSYSNVGYALFTWLFDRVGGTESFSQRCLHDQLGLNHIGFNIADIELAQGHGLDGRKQPPWHANALSPAIGLKANLDDVMTFLRYFSPDFARKTLKLTSMLKRELNQLNKKREYKLIDGWFLIRAGSSLVYYYTGRTGGHQVSVSFIPRSMKGVVVFSNGAAGSNHLSMLIIDMIDNVKNKSK